MSEERVAESDGVIVGRIRVAVVTDGTAVPAWVHSVFTSLDRSSEIDWALTIVVAGSESGGHRNELGVRAFEAIDARRHARQTTDACALRDATALVGERELVPVDDDRDLASLSLDDPVDVVLDFRARSNTPPPAALARFGSWRAEPASAIHRGADAVFWAIHDRQPVCDVQVVVRASESAEPLVVATATVGLQPASLTLSRSLCYWRAATLVRQQLERFVVGDWHPNVASASRELAEPTRVVRDSPSTSATALVAGRQLRSAIGHRIGARRTREQWLLGIRVRATDPPTFDDVGFRAITPPPDRAFADPFLLEHESSTYLFLEEIEFARGRGVISVTTVNDDGEIGTPEVVLERPYHLSYPFVFRDGSDIFMVPESAANRTVELYRAADFPRRWELHDLLLEDVRALDSSLLHHDGRYWLFTSIEEPGRNRNDELHLFTSAALGGPWVPHPRNPVVSDVRCARPAGRPFLMDGAVIRPAQDCSLRYGGSIAFQRIDVLSEDRYSEQTIATLGPTWAPSLEATHTFNALGRIDVIDGLRHIPRR